MSFWLTELRALVQKIGDELEFYHSPRLYGANCSQMLADLVEQNSKSCWILGRSTEQIQGWFQENKIPAIVAGSLYDGIQLPSVDTHYRAVGQHAVGTLFAHGHRRIALLASKRDATELLPGMTEIERGMRETFTGDRHALENEFVSIHHNHNDKADVCRGLDRLLSLPEPPTAILIANSATLLTAITHLAQREVVVPRDLSIVVAETEGYYCHIVPELAHYEPSTEAFAKHMYRGIQHAMDHTLSPDFRVRIMPRFVHGETLARRGRAGRTVTAST